MELDLDRSAWRSVTGTFGVVQLVSTGERPAPVPAGVFEEITARAGSDGLIELLPPPLRKGEPLQIASGALVQCRGFFKRMADGGWRAFGITSTAKTDSSGRLSESFRTFTRGR